jgi:hypothetical protein
VTDGNNFVVNLQMEGEMDASERKLEEIHFKQSPKRSSKMKTVSSYGLIFGLKERENSVTEEQWKCSQQ